MTSDDRIWGPGYRVFLSHKAEEKLKATELKVALKGYGVSAFVAHEDIQPTTEWQEEIKEALGSMQAFVALLTDEFQNSPWTDQEIGYALCREVPIIPVRLGIDPYGFLGTVQALSCGWLELPWEIVQILLERDTSLINDYIGAVEQCGNFDDANRLSRVLDRITSLSNEQALRLVNAYNENHQVSQSFGFNGNRWPTYGKGLAHHLGRLTDSTYSRRGDQIEEDWRW